MKVLVTGGAGYIGGTVTRLLLERGHEVTILDNLLHSKRSAVAPGAAFVQGELADRSLVESTLRDGGFEGVLHFAALIEAGESMQKPETFFRNNTATTLTLLESMLATGVNRLVFSSTAACYGEPKSTPILEDAALEPTNPYGESKLLVEHMLRWLNQIHGFRYASLRYFNVAGAIPGYGEAHEPETHLIPLVLDVALGRRPSIKIFGSDYPTEDGTCVRDYIHVQDLADAHLLALSALETKSKLIYNIGNGQGFTVREVVESDVRSRWTSSLAGRAIRRCLLPARRRSSRSSAGRRASLTSTASSRPRGSGTSSATNSRAGGGLPVIGSMFHLGPPLLEKIARPVIVYVCLILFLRLFGKRELAQLNPFDLVVLLSLSNTVQNAIIGDDNSVTGGLLGAFSLLTINWLLMRFLFHFPKVDKSLQGSQTVLIQHGQVDRAAMQQETMTDVDLLSVLHRQGFDDASEVERCVLEPNGTFTVEGMKPTSDDRQRTEITAMLRSLMVEVEGLKAQLAESRSGGEISPGLRG